MSNTYSGKIPQKWAIAKLEDLVIKFVGGGTPSRENLAYYQGNIPWMTVKDMTTRRPQAVTEHITLEAVTDSATNLIPPDTIIIATRMSLGKVVRVPFEVAINQDLKALILFKNIDEDFLENWLITEAHNIQSLGKGTTVKGIRLEVLQQLEVPLPPLNEQRRIVAKIEALRARSQRVKEALEAIPLLLDQFRQSVLAAAFRGDLTADWREKNPDVEPASVLLERIRVERRHRWEEAELAKMRLENKEPTLDTWKQKYEEPKKLNSKVLPELPSGWCWARVQDVGEVQLGRQRSPKNHTGEYMRKYLRSANITWNGLGLSDVKEMNFHPDDFERFRLRYGDVLLNEASGSQYEVGKPAIWRDEIPDCCIQNTLIRVRPSKPISKFLYYHFFWNAISGAFGNASKGIGIHHLGRQLIAQWLICVPPIEEQKEIVFRVQKMLKTSENIQKQYSETKANLNQLDQSILAKAFRGELVPQDPNDEPASVLLERIRAEREKIRTKTVRKSTAKSSRQGTKKAQLQEKLKQMELELE